MAQEGREGRKAVVKSPFLCGPGDSWCLGEKIPPKIDFRPVGKGGHQHGDRADNFRGQVLGKAFLRLYPCAGNCEKKYFARAWLSHHKP